MKHRPVGASGMTAQRGEPMLEITAFSKENGPLTKRITIAPDGTLRSDGSACVMSSGTARRATFDSLAAFATYIGDVRSHQAIALGALDPGLPDRVKITTKETLARLNGAAAPNLIARTSSHITYKERRSTLALIDIDTKGMPREVKARIDAVGGFWEALVSVLPDLATAARVSRRSTSTGIRRTDTGETLPGSNGLHVYVHVRDGSDVERFLRTFHDRLWVHGFGWHVVGAGGQLLDRSLVDRMVYAPERLVFEGPPILVGPLEQNEELRCPQVHDGGVVDTVTICPPLRLAETAHLQRIKAQSAQALNPERAQARERFVAAQATRLAEKAGITNDQARRVIERQCDGIPLPDLVLPWDADEFSGCTVADVLANPSRSVGATMSDPLEGPDYGHTKAMVMQRADGSLWINSFAHGRTVYELRYDARAVDAAIAAVPNDQAADLFVRMALNASLDPDQLDTLRNRVADRTGVGKRALDAKLKVGSDEYTARSMQEERDRKLADRRDPRPQIPVPRPDAPWLPQMKVLNDILGGSDLVEPPMRDIDGVVTQVRVRRIPNMHAFTSQGANEGETEETQQPATEQPLLTRLDEMQLAELIEGHIDYVNMIGLSVHLPSSFVKHFLTRHDCALPTVTAIATLPIVLPDGTLLATPGLDRQRGIFFRVPPDLLSCIPKPEECTPSAVAAALHFLIAEWLCDVSATYVGKCILIGAALTIIERSVLTERPAFFVTAGRRGGGKTTVLIMLLMAVMGVRPPAAAWSTNEEERRKSLLSYLLEGLGAIIWDNIGRGTQISCPHIEKSCTTAVYSDRRLGVSEMVSASASAVHLFTGNNIGPKGDLASRSLNVRLEVHRPDPENRDFRRTDPIGWTEVNRGKLLRALYTILLGNPALQPGSGLTPQTRFKNWWRLVGSAVENAAKEHADGVGALALDRSIECPPVTFSFGDLFLSQEDDDEDNTSLSDALEALNTKWPHGTIFRASDVARLNLNPAVKFAAAPESRPSCGA